MRASTRRASLRQLAGDQDAADLPDLVGVALEGRDGDHGPQVRRIYTIVWQDEAEDHEEEAS